MAGHVVTQLDPYAARPSRGRILALPHAEKYGASMRAILRELDYDEESIEAMLENGAISESWSRAYLPSRPVGPGSASHWPPLRPAKVYLPGFSGDGTGYTAP